MNDCAGVSRDLAEGKKTSVTILLSSLNDLSASSYAVDSQELQTAIDIVRQRGITELVHFNDLIRNIKCSENSLTELEYNILHVISCVAAYVY